MLKIGIAGATGLRASAFPPGLASTGKARVTAVCGSAGPKLEKVSREWNATAYTNYLDMLDRADLDAVILSTPVTLHTEQAIAALERNIHVFSEIPAAATMDECERLVDAVKHSKATYCLGENMVYMREYMAVENMIKQGLFGDVYYMQGEYLHDIKFLFDASPWRKTLMAYNNGVTYGTHNLGPMLIWMPGDRIDRVMCTGTGHHYLDESTGKPFVQEDGCLMICRTAQGRSVDVRVELMSTRPYELNYRMQGTMGVYENLHCWTHGESRIWTKSLDGAGQPDEWLDFEKICEDYLPQVWREVPEEIMRTTTHWGVDYVTMREYVAHLLGERPFRVDIHKAMDLTLPGIVSTMSINQGSVWMDVPDSRKW